MTDDMHDKPVVTIHQVVVDELGNEVRRLSAINDDMLAALEAVLPRVWMMANGDWEIYGAKTAAIIQAALAKARGE